MVHLVILLCFLPCVVEAWIQNTAQMLWVDWSKLSLKLPHRVCVLTWKKMSTCCLGVSSLSTGYVYFPIMS